MNILLILFSVGPFRFKQKWQQETMLTMEHQGLFIDLNFMASGTSPFSKLKLKTEISEYKMHGVASTVSFSMATKLFCKNLSSPSLTRKNLGFYMVK